MNNRSDIKTLGALVKAGYKYKSIKEELRENLIVQLQNKTSVFEGIWGYEETVIPDIERAILSGHDVNLLGLRGQAKTRIARMMVNLLDEFIPVIAGSEINDDPFRPISNFGKRLIEEKGDDTPIEWLHRSDRYTEKLATPDVSVADLIGDIDPIKAATLKLPYNDERVIHFGLIPRSHRGIFVINEVPDLQARIQVSLFNILQEGDIQIRGFKLRLPLDIQFVFTANPEDYTNRGSIVTPLKDRIGSQIITHYPKTIETGKKITQQEANIKPLQEKSVRTNVIIEDLIEQLAIEARDSEYIDSKSGVSARLTISAFENVVSAAERRALVNGEKETDVRIGDLIGIIPAITGKVELVYEGEQEGPMIVAQNLIGKAIRKQFLNYFPDPDMARKMKDKNPYSQITEWFSDGNTLSLESDFNHEAYKTALKSVPGLNALIQEPNSKLKIDSYFLMEFALHGMAEYSMLSKQFASGTVAFKDLFSNMFHIDPEGDSLSE